MSAVEAVLLALILVYRAALGLGTLAPDPALHYCATVKVVDQMAQGRISHVEASGRELRGLLTVCRLPPERTYAEVLGAVAYVDGRPGEPVFVFDAWVASPAHDAILRDPAYTRIGIAAWGPYWVVHLMSEP